MGLHVRVRHSLGARQMDLPERGIDRPLLIGRDPGADILIPSSAIGAVHCMIYLHEGNWVIQEGQGEAGIYINGQRLEGSAFLSGGDVITLGKGATAPQIEVARQANRAAAVAAAPVPVEAAATATEPAMSPDTAAEAESDAWSGQSEWAPAPTVAPISYRRRPRKNQSSNGVVIGVIATVVILLGAWGIIAWHSKEPTPAPKVAGPTSAPAASPVRVVQPPPQRPVEVPTVARPELVAPDSSAPTTAPSVEPVQQAVVQPADATPEEDPIVRSPAWEAVLGAHDGGLPPDQQLRAFEFFRSQHPGKQERQLRAFTNEALDDLWWVRLGQLIKERRSIDDRLAAINSEMAGESDEAYLKTRRVRKAAIEQEMASNNATFAEMGYSGDGIPEAVDHDHLERMRAARDQEQFAKWGEAVVKSIERRRFLPWEHRR